jgi:hypothetical protein
LLPADPLCLIKKTTPPATMRMIITAATSSSVPAFEGELVEDIDVEDVPDEDVPVLETTELL